MTAHGTPAPDDAGSIGYLQASLARDGYIFVPGPALHALLDKAGSLADWDHFSASWNGLEIDTYMADRGRYRRRRHAVFVAPQDGPIQREENRPHYQALDYNPLNGGIERWFEPVLPDIGNGPSLTAILHFCRGLFGRLAPNTLNWYIEAHQFRIETAAQAKAFPTPEGMHRDGVDYVLVLMIRRQNIRRGTTLIHGPDHRQLGSFTLTEPFDAALVEDARVYHGVTPVEAIDPAQPAWRDVLVVTFKAA